MAEDDAELSGSRPRVLLCVTGSVAAIKLPQLVQLLSAWADVRVVATQAARNFIDKEQLPAAVPLLGDEDEWRRWQALGDPVLHIELRRWADVLLIAPLSANTLAKLAGGLCDNLVTCVVRAWDERKPLLVAPAMNTHMWDHPLTGEHLSALWHRGYTLLPPVAKRLACGDVGQGAMAAPEDIDAAARRARPQARLRRQRRRRILAGSTAAGVIGGAVIFAWLFGYQRPPGI